MNLLYALERLRTPFWDAVFSAVTHLGEETVFMVAAILIFWCVSKEEGYYLLLMGFFGTVVNQFLKLLFRIPRPWVRDPDFTIVESARAQATGYSFPSGHTQNAVATFGGIARSTRRPWVRWTCVAVLLAVSFSRLYLGVHTPLDVGVSFAVELGLHASMEAEVGFTFSVNRSVVLQTVLVYLAIFALTLLSTLVKVGRGTAMSLLHSESFGEKPAAEKNEQ